MFQHCISGDENERYRTPASFRRTKDSEEAQKKLDVEGYREKNEECCKQQTECWHQVEELARESAMSNPYLDRGYTMPYQISQNRYREQIFGAKPEYNYPQAKLEPLAGRDKYQTNPYQSPRQPQYDQRPQQYDQRPQQYDQRPQQYAQPSQQYDRPQNNYQESPRQAQYDQRRPQYDQPPQQFEPRTYRSGRPDLGFENYQNNSVPYPQEPMRSRKPYEHPPDIGFYPNTNQDEYKKSDNPEEIIPKRPANPEDGVSKRPTSSRQSGTEPHPGWLMLLRFHRDGEAQVRHALTMCTKHIEGDGGRILGIARSYGIRIREGGDAWVKFGKMRYSGGGNWDVQQNPTHDETSYCILAVYYPSLSRAIQWFDRDSWFKQKDFPAPYTTDCIVLPLNSSVDTKFCKTLVMTEYPRISHPEYFRDKFSVPTEDMMRKRFRASPYVVKASSIPVDDPRQRVARHLRGCWIKRNSIITLSMFDSMQEGYRYFSDPEFEKCKDAQDRVSAPTTVVMDLEDWRI